jgi:hypothetical protein
MRRTLGEASSLSVACHPNWRVPGIELVLDGLVFRVAWTGAPGDSAKELLERSPGELDPAVPRDYLTQKLIGRYRCMRGLGHETLDWPAVAWRGDEPR